MNTHEQAMSADDIALLRRSTRGVTLAFGLTLMMAVLMFAAVAAILLVGVYAKGMVAWLMYAVALALLCLPVAMSRHLLRAPRSWRAIRAACRGEIPKQIVSGVLQSFGRASRPGIAYGLDSGVVEVALPYWNQAAGDSGSGMRASAAAARLGVPVRLHLLPLLPGRPPVLLRADYPGGETVQHYVEPLNEEDKSGLSLDGKIASQSFYAVAGLIAIVSLFTVWLLSIIAAVFVMIGYQLDRHYRVLKRASVKHGVRGVVDEVVSFVISSGNSPVTATQRNYRIGGVLYQVGQLEPVALPGQRVVFEYIETGRRSNVPLKVSAETESSAAALTAS